MSQYKTLNLVNKVGKKNLAKEAWEKVLQIAPDNRAVIEALKQTN